VIGYVGRFIHLKGVTLLAAAFHNIVRQVPDARLLLIGHGEDEKSLRTLLTAEITRGLVHIESGIEHTQLPSWYRAMDLFVMPSRYENFSNAVLEAMACGVPVLASQVGGNSLLKESGAGWLFPPGSPTLLSNTLHTALQEGAELKSRGQVGLDFVQGRYSWEQSAACLEQILVQRLGIPT
jgi:glycosyltransferase involved in cell wall biosynthesis